MIEAKDVTKRYGSFLAVDGISFSVNRGGVVGFLGLNGAGKTTTIKMVSCFMPPSRGSLTVDGLDTVRQSDEVRTRIGYLPERVPLYDDLRVDEYLRFRARLKGVRGGGVKAAVDRVVSRCGLLQKRRSPIGTLSKGQRQRVGIADALVHEPSLLILDEPTSGLDPDQRLEVRKLVTELRGERTVFLSTHILPEAEAVCDQVIIIHRGRIRAADALSHLRSERQMTRVVHAGPPLATYANDAVVRIESTENDQSTVVVRDAASASRIVVAAVEARRAVLEVTTVAPTLEAIFLRITGGMEEIA